MEMAARTRKIFHDEDTRKRIKAAALIDRLQNFALGNNPDAMSRTQVAAALGLLNKVLANPMSVDVTPEKTTVYVLRAPPESESTEAWLRDYGPKPKADAQLLQPRLVGAAKA
jgi:hypothetical protein